MRPVGGELQRVVHQVPDDLFHPGRVGMDDQRLCRQLQLDSGGVLLVQHHSMNVAQHGAEIDVGHLQFELAGAHTRHVEQIIDDPCLAVDCVTDGIDGLGRRPSRANHRQATQQLGVELNQIQWMLEFVGHHREEFIAQGNAVARLQQLLVLLVLLTFVPGQVAGDLDVALQVIATEQGDFAAAEEAAAILALMPALVFGAPLRPGCRQLAFRHAGGAVFRGENEIVKRAFGLGLAVAENQFGAFVPAGNHA